MPDSIPTCFAPAERKTIEQVRVEHNRILKTPHVQVLLEGFPTPAVILNECRQIVAVNQKLCQFLKRGQDELLGMRPGEAFNCIHWSGDAGGCGTTRYCETCGAVNAILNSQGRGGQDSQECTITVQTKKGEESLDLRVTASSFNLDGKLTVFSISDISDQKRRAVLERMFFHDVLNTAAGVRGLLEALTTMSEERREETIFLAYRLADFLVEEIEGGRNLAAAERGDLVVNTTLVDARKILKSVCELYVNHPVSRGKPVIVTEVTGPCVVTTDKLLLKRVLGNLVKNALEASQEGQKVSLGFQNRGSAVFHVHNESAMPESVRLQVFKRSFSTKSSVGRGIGTYSAKLIAERYLGGLLNFTSSEEHGTTFSVRLPA